MKNKSVKLIKPLKNNKGESLIEALATLTVLSIALLILFASFLTSIKLSTSANIINAETTEIYKMLETNGGTTTSATAKYKVGSSNYSTSVDYSSVVSGSGYTFYKFNGAK